MKLLLDADTVSYALRGTGGVDTRIRSYLPSELGLSAITVAELRFGAHLRGSRKLHRLVDSFIEELGVLPFDGAAAHRYGRLAASLRTRGAPIGVLDTMLAAHALELGLTLVTHNTKHFEKVRGLKLEDWFVEGP